MGNFLKTFLGTKGSTTLQVLFAGSALLGLSYYVMQANQDRSKQQRGVQNRIVQSIIQKEISEVLSDGKTCLSTLSKVSPLQNNASFNAIYNQADQKVYEVGKEIYGSKITRITLRNYVPATGLKLHGYPPTAQSVSLQITVSNNEVGNVSYGARDRSYQIPLLIETFNDQVQTCISDDGAGSAMLAYARACTELGGEMDANFHCSKYHGSDGHMIKSMRENFCEGGNCNTHPYAKNKCINPNVGEHDAGNWVATGFNDNGVLECKCIPRVCPAPNMICLGSIETNYCGTDCLPGTRTDGPCACVDWNPYPAWSPDPSTVCPTVTLSRKRTCKTPAGAGEETETTSGTSTAPSCCTATFSPAANPADICEGQSVVQSRVCFGTTETQTVAGTKKCAGAGCTVLHPIGWSVDLDKGSNCHCAEYFSAPGSGAATSILPDGETKDYTGTYCQVHTSGSGTFVGNGSITLKCDKGSLITVSQTCEGGEVK